MMSAGGNRDRDGERKGGRERLSGEWAQTERERERARAAVKNLGPHWSVSSTGPGSTVDFHRWSDV